MANQFNTPKIAILTVVVEIGDKPEIASEVLAKIVGELREAGCRVDSKIKIANDDTESRNLTTREAETLLWLSNGYSVPEIAVQLQLSRLTVAGYAKALYSKLNVSSRAELTHEAQRLGLFQR